MQKIKNTTLLFTFLLITWGLFRLIIKLPHEIEELIIKPIIWIIPVLFLVRQERQNLKSIGISFDNLFKSIYFSLILGSVFVIIAIVTNYLKYGELNFNANIGTTNLIATLVISFATAISEEIVFRGYIFTRLWRSLNNELYANLITSTGWVIIHVPITIFVNKLSPAAAFVYLFLTFIYGIGSAFVFARTKNISSSILLHVLWEWPINLFR